MLKRSLTKNMLVARAGHPDAPTREEYSVLKRSLMKNMLVAQAVCNAHVDEKAAGTNRMPVTPANACCNALASSHGTH